ncbi:unnamed protein product [Urochloa decumbens]|uniref:Uncharacterized protein n=1 Tax=Urochloa decumbens TaxID=240449 RepID=A0ABC9GZB7_9POAL
MDDIPYYGDFIRNMNDICQQSIVCIQIRSKNDVSVGTGIVVASGDRSCFVMTSSALTKARVGEARGVGTVEFFDGTIHRIDWNRVKDQKEVSFIHISDKMIHWEAVNFSNIEAVEGQRVFSYGYDSTSQRRYISGNLVSGTGIANNEDSQFVHGCSTGLNGHQGSAVFNETQQLVGMNISYTRSKGKDYIDPPKKSGPGGLVSALDLQTIKHMLQLFCNKSAGKSLQETLQDLQKCLRVMEG